MSKAPISEAVRLTRKFFPESKPFVSDDQGIFWNDFLEAMCATNQGGYDSSNDCWKSPDGFPLTRHSGVPISKTGLLFEAYDKAFLGILGLTGFNPSGRVLIIPESFTVRTKAHLEANELPFVCAFHTTEEKGFENLMKATRAFGGELMTPFLFLSQGRHSSSTMI